MRTTIRIDEQLLEEAKREAIRQKKSLTAVIEDALRAALARQQNAGKRIPVKLVTFSGKGLLPGVDLDDSAALLDLMESKK
jgi:K+-transporting ATPase c subunit